MKKRVLLIFLLSFFMMGLGAAPYVGISQGLVSTTVELGYLTRSVDQNLALSFPTIPALETSDGDFYQYPTLSLNVNFKHMFFEQVSLAAGPTLRMGWEYKEALLLKMGLSVQLSLEAPGVMDILFVEYSYLPSGLTLMEGSPTSSMLEEGAEQFLRFGWRHAF